MASNNTTEVVTGVVQPRFYQVYGDLIESKEIMEPLAISAGTGPICGFDWVDTSRPNVTITSIFKANSGAKGLSMLKGKSKRVFLSDKNNIAGQVFNAYTTPDGLCHIAPDTLTFNGMQPSGGWPSTSNPNKMVSFIVKASHTYKPNNSENPPSISNFTCNWVEIDRDMPLSNILSWNYQSVLDLLSSNAIKFDSNTEVIIGLYLVGWRSSWNNSDPQLKDIMASINYTLCLVPTEGRFPVSPFGLNPLDILDIKSRMSTLESKVPTINNMDKYLSTQMNSRGNGVEMEYTVTSEGDEDVYTFTKLIINGCKLVNEDSPVKKTVQYQWIEGGIGLCICVVPYVNILESDSLSDNQWGIAAIGTSIGHTTNDYWDGSLNMGIHCDEYQRDDMIPVAVFEINFFQNSRSPHQSVLPCYSYSLLSNNRYDGLSRLIYSIFKYMEIKGDQDLFRKIMDNPFRLSYDN